ncbi:hypothetical protein [Thermosporothrix hazakensis]|uniref:hypothetical protein n=1 Tax=Thermosporothrix hazakensis TaxID=644383 RepID=UPI0014762A55|nr:hypothetical protein [Thermosporothrix hazakensis]
MATQGKPTPPNNLASRRRSFSATGLLIRLLIALVIGGIFALVLFGSAAVSH